MKLRISSDQIPKIYRSALISTGGFLIAFALFFLAKALFPSYDFSELQKIMLGAMGAFIANFVRLLVTIE